MYHKPVKLFKLIIIFLDIVKILEIQQDLVEEVLEAKVVWLDHIVLLLVLVQTLVEV
jgi:hypothetical protein